MRSIFSKLSHTALLVLLVGATMLAVAGSASAETRDEFRKRCVAKGGTYTGAGGSEGLGRCEWKRCQRTFSTPQRPPTPATFGVITCASGSEDRVSPA